MTVPDRRWMALYAILVLAVLELLRQTDRVDLVDLLEETWQKLSANYEEDLRRAHDQAEVHGDQL